MSAPAAPQLRPAAEIQRAHDLITGILLDEALRESLQDGWVEALKCMAEVCCWTLRHDHNPAFANTLAVLEKWLQRCGVVVADSGQLSTPGRVQ